MISGSLNLIPLYAFGATELAWSAVLVGGADIAFSWV
jgi:hypothetical protein